MLESGRREGNAAWSAGAGAGAGARARARASLAVQGYLYVLRDPSMPGNVFKIGRTCDLKRRLSEYPKGCYFVRTFGCIVDCHDCERRLIGVFKERFSRYGGRGLEYFVGDMERVTDAFETFCTRDPSPMQC
eukprot:jgi/Tetstr1/453943/TSEL_040862.t1